MRTIRHLALTLLIIATVASRARAQAWTGPGVPVCTADGLQGNVRAVPDSAGGAYVGWTDRRAGTNGGDIYVVRIGSDGQPAPGWPVNGLAVCSAIGDQTLFSMTPDGSGGVYLAWEDLRAGVSADIYGHHVLADASFAAGWPADGLAICDFTAEQVDPELTQDGAGGVFCVWVDARTNPFSQHDVYAQHLNFDGTRAVGWADDGMRVTNGRSNDTAPSLAPDGTGGLYVTWTRALNGQDIGAQHLGAAGTPYPTWPDTGLVLCGAANDQSGSGVVPAPGGTAIAMWKDLRNYNSPTTEVGLYGVRFGPDTTVKAPWLRQGRAFYTSLNGISAPFTASDGAGGVLFGWGELVSASDEDLFVMHVDTVASIIVSLSAPSGALPVCPSPAYQDPVAFVPDGAGGLFVGFADYRDAGPSFANPDPYVQHVTGGATIAPGWPGLGVAFTQETTRETGTLPVPVVGGVIGVYARGTSPDIDLYASLVGDDGEVPALVSLASTEASPGRVRIEWSVSGGASEAWRIEKRGEADAWREVARAFADGTGRVAYTDTDVEPGARYGYRLVPASGGTALGEAWVVVPAGAAAFGLRGVSPNPVAAGARVRFALPEPGEAALALVDVQGRERARWAVGAGTGEREFVLSGLSEFAPGIYWLRLAQGVRTASTRVALIGH